MVDDHTGGHTRGQQEPSYGSDATFARVIAAIEPRRLLATPRRPFVVGLCGAQGSGKSTLAGRIAKYYEGAGIVPAVLSIDDLYLTRAEREGLAQSVHPLLRIRGVPGTHDIDLGLDVFRALDQGMEAALPRFDKATDDRMPQNAWQMADPITGIIILEGWCVGAVPQSEAALKKPVNRLECDEDPHAIWRRYANHALAGMYQELFARIDALVLLAAPSFDIVRIWRIEQEAALRAGGGGSGVMTDVEIARFVEHYERLTRHILAEMPGRADVVIGLDERRRAVV